MRAVMYVGEILAGAVCARASPLGRPQSIAVNERALQHSQRGQQQVNKEAAACLRIVLFAVTSAGADGLGGAPPFSKLDPEHMSTFYARRPPWARAPGQVYLLQLRICQTLFPCGLLSSK